MIPGSLMRQLQPLDGCVLKPFKTVCGRINQMGGFEVLTVVNIMIIFFWDLLLCVLVGRYQDFGETCSLHLHGGKGL
jgi:hypothetical protein